MLLVNGLEVEARTPGGRLARSSMSDSLHPA